MCDPVTVAFGALGAVAGRQMTKASSAGATAAAMPDPAAEQAATEAKAAQAANAKLAADQKRRREQQSLLAKGAPMQTTGPTLGDTANAGAMNSPLSGGTTNRSAAGRQMQSLLARGAAASGVPTPAAVARPVSYTGRALD